MDMDSDNLHSEFYAALGRFVVAFSSLVLTMQAELVEMKGKRFPCEDAAIEFANLAKATAQPLRVDFLWLFERYMVRI
jgi:hypothetical protein